MPGLDGFEVLRRLEASPRTAAIPVLAVTAAAPDATPRAIEGDCSGFVREPFDFDALIAVVRSYVGAREAVPRRVGAVGLGRPDRGSSTCSVVPWPDPGDSAQMGPPWASTTARAR
jgi:DNA-binding response OmpR family regulator